MIRYRLTLLAFLAGTLPLLSAPPKFKVEVVTTEHADTPSGVIRFEDSYGDLNVETWDQPGVQIIVTRFTYVIDTATEKDRATQELNALKITAEKKGNDLVIQTPRRRRFHTAARLDYRVMVPRNAHLAIQHREGAVVIAGVEGGIDASVRMGDILLTLPGTVNYSFDADCREGRIQSNFAGAYHRRHWYAEHYTGEKSSAAPVHLHVGIGGIDIRKL